MKSFLKLLIFIVLLGNLNLYAQTPVPVYTKASDLTMVGDIMPTKNIYYRLDSDNYPDLPPAVKRLLTNTAGKAICFTTNSQMISAKWCVSNKKQLANLTPIANKGLDLYIKKDGKWQFAGVGRPGEICSEDILVKDMDNSQKECLLYLPLYDEASNLEIGIDQNATIKAAANPFTKRILIYGSSITQGASASRPGMAYPARLSRATGLNFLNLGLSGSAKMEKAVADMIASIPADAYILDCVPNPSPQQIKERTNYLVSTIRKNHPEAPIIVIQSIIRESGFWNQKAGKTVKQQNENIQHEVEILHQQGVQSLYFIPGENLIGQDHEGSIDGTHPNDLGFDRMVKQLEPQIMAILKKHGI